MFSIRARLIQVFSLEIIALGLAAAFSLALHTKAVNQYKSVTDTMVAEYHLIDTTSNLSDEFNRLSLSSTTVDQSREAQLIRAQESQITQLYQYLDVSITDSQTRASYEGLKNTINTLESEINSGVVSVERGEQDASQHYTKANQLYGFVQVDGTSFLASELRYVTGIQKQIKAATTRDFQIASITYVLVTVGSLVYVVRMSKVIIRPIAQLTSTAEAISRGDMLTDISPLLLARKDETGRLSKSFNVMLLKLKQIIAELNQEKNSVEKKIIQRTQELADEKLRLEASINSLDVGFIMTDTEDEIIMMNLVASKLLAYAVTPEGVSRVESQEVDWTTKLIDSKMGHDFPFKENLAKLHEGVTIDRKELNYGGRVFTVFMAPIVDPHSLQQQNFLGTVILLEDVTEAKVMERSKEEFFSIASHELRTPLTAIRGNTSMIQTYYQDQLKSKDLKAIVDDIHDSSIRLIEIVNDFLDASRLEQGKIQYRFQEFAIEQVIDEVLYELGQSHNEAVELRFDRPKLALPLVYADKDRVKQIVYNLVGNALKFTEKGSVTLSAQEATDHLRVCVADTGIGLSPEAQRLLFHKFQQAGSSILSRDTSRGTGLGLYISKLMAEQMNGSLQLEASVPNSGSTFSFTLPLAGMIDSLKERKEDSDPA